MIAKKKSNSRKLANDDWRVVSMRFERLEGEAFAKFHGFLKAEAARFSGDTSPGDIVPAIGFFLGYPRFAEYIGHERRGDDARREAFHFLEIAHAGAVCLLVAEAERLGLDGGALHLSGRLCRDLYRNEPQRYYAGEAPEWPNCLGNAREGLPADKRAILDAGEAVLARLNARLGAVGARPPMAPEANAEASHSEDFTTVNWFGREYVFDRGQQAAAIRVLWEAFTSGGHGLSEATIGQNIGSVARKFRLVHVFRRKVRGRGGRAKNVAHEAWGAMIRRVSAKVYRLEKPKKLE